MLKVTAHLVNGDQLDMGTVSRERLRRLQAEGFEDRELIHELITDDWGAPPRYVELVGADGGSEPLRIVIRYD